MKFTVQHKDPATRARAGELQTDHGIVRTPIFMPVGTAAAVKGIFHRDVRDEARAQIILANTYHLYLRPGMEIIERAGGVHRFSSWEGPMLTDSGGFQVFSLADCRKLREEGCHFRSHIDGSKQRSSQRSVRSSDLEAYSRGASPGGHSSKAIMMSAPIVRSVSITLSGVNRCFDPSMCERKWHPSSRSLRPSASEKT